MKYKVGKSKIEGDGLFANKALKENELIGLAHLNDEPTEIVGKYHNHSDNPNAYSVKVKNKRFIYALRDLKPGEEITVDYRKQPELEQPEMFKRGGQKKYTRDITATNFLNAEHFLSKKPKRNKKRIYSPTAKYYAEGGEPGKPDPRTQFYTVQGSDGVYRKVNGKWEVDWNRSGKFQPLSKGDVAKRTAILNSQAKPLYDPVYDDLYATQRQQFTPLPVNKPTPAKSTGKIESFDNSLYTADETMEGKPVNYVDKNDPSKHYVLWGKVIFQPGRPGGSLIKDENEIAKIKKNIRVATQFDLDRLPANQMYSSPEELEYISRAASGEDPYAVRAELKNREAANKAQIFFDNNFQLKDENPNEWDPQQKDLMQDVSDKGQQFMKDWQNSPMYWEMLSNSLPGDQSKYMPYYASGRDNQLSILNPLYMTEAYTPDEWSKSTGLTAAAESVGEGRVYIYPKTYSDIPQFALPTHEYSHVADDNGRLIPQKDIDLMRSFLGDPMERKRQFSNYDYDTSNEGRQKIKAQYDYISNPTETRARLNELRFLGKESGIYDPFTQKVTPEIFKQLNNLESSPGYNQPLEDLRDVYTDEQILEMLNTISKNNESNQEFNFAQKGGQQGDRFKKRLMKRYPGMTGVYGDEGENLNIVKDPNYDARSAGYGDIEFTFPGDDPVLNYPNLVEEGGPDYNYPNPSPDKYTALYNPRGANRGDIFLDMMHGMRDDPNYQPLLQNFEKAVRDARGEDMDWYYDQQVKKGSTQSKERYDENYIDSQLRAELAPGSIGMFSHGRRDYRKDRRYDSPEMRAAAEDIRNYLKGEYEDGGELDTYPKGGGPGKGKKGKKVQPYVTSDPKEYEYRKAAYDDSLWLYQNNLRTPPLLKPNKQKYNANDSWFRKLAKWSVDENVIGRKNLTLSPEEFRKGLNTTWKSEGVGRILNQLMGDASDGKSTQRQILYTTDEANKHFYSPAYNKYYQIGKPINNKIGYYSTLRDLPDNEPIKYVGNMYRAKNNSGESGDRISNFEPRYKKPVQPVLFQEPPKPKPKVNQYPKEYKPVVNNIPQTPPEGKTIIGYEEVQQLNPKTGVVTTVKDPIYTDLERPIPTLHPTRVNPELQKFVYPETETEGTDIMPVYDETDIEVGTPGPGGHWEDKYSRYIDWDGNSIAFNGIRFRKPGHGGDLIRKGKRHYIHYPSIEKRYDAWIEPDELPKEEYQDGGLVEVRGYEGNKFRKNANGKWEYESGRPVEDQLLIQKLTYESKPVGSPVVQGAPKPPKLKPIANSNISKPIQKIYPSRNPSETLQQVANMSVPQSQEQRANLEEARKLTAQRKFNLESFLVQQGYNEKEAASIVASYGDNWPDLEEKYAREIATMQNRVAAREQGETPDKMSTYTPRPAQAWNDKLQDIVFNPFTSAGYLIRGQEIPDYMGEQIDNGTLGYWSNGRFIQGRNALDTAIDVATPIGWAHSADNIINRATNDESGDFWTEETVWDALNIAPGLKFLKGAKGLKAANTATGLARYTDNMFDLAQRARLTASKPLVVNAAIDAGSIMREPFYAPQRPSLFSPAVSPLQKTLLPNTSLNVNRVMSDASKFTKLNNMLSAPTGTIHLAQQVLGEVLQGNRNRKAIAAGNDWLENWISHPVTQDKVNLSMDIAKKNRIASDDEIDLLREQSLKFKPISAEYPLSNQLKDNLQQYKGYSNKENIHSGNLGVSYTHKTNPFNRDLYSYKKPWPEYGSWISRSPLISDAKRRSTTIHEGTHDWTSRRALDVTAQRISILNSMNPDIKKDFLEWEDLRSQGKSDSEIEKIMGVKRSDNGYYANPTEMHARIMQLRDYFNLTPDMYIGSRTASDMIKKLESLPSYKQPINVKMFLKVIDKDPDNLSYLFNRLWAVPPALMIGNSMLGDEENQ